MVRLPLPHLLPRPLPAPDITGFTEDTDHTPAWSHHEHIACAERL